jgi:hypothetical protein
VSHRFDPDTLQNIEKPSAEWSVLPFSIELPPLQLESRFALEISGGKPRGRVVHRRSVEIRDFSGPSLSISDIVLTVRDGETGCTGIIDPFPAYETGSSLCVSYEIYNLRRDAENLSRYRITWSVISTGSNEKPSGTWDWIIASIRPASPEPRVYISSSIEQRTFSATARDNLIIDIASLEPGRYLLTVEIEDLVSDSSVSEEKSFAVIPRTGW